MRPRFLLLARLARWPARPLAAQTVPSARRLAQRRRQTSRTGRKNQKIERIHVEDSGATIDELRYGGQTQSITVQPKADVPAYEMQPSDLARTPPGRPPRRHEPARTGTRVWNVFKF